MRYLFFTVLLLYTTVKCFGGVISEKVVDTSGKPVGFANVISINDADSSFVAGTTTDVNGLFTISFEPKTQMLKISCVGFDDCFIVPTASNQVGHHFERVVYIIG